ncbi:non-canonical purine NTP pyrophosphatase [Virgibacillus halophilus]|uniref:Non-canonical purine NTP pyrophosphatase n=1 Tax=Tigheibacillus halophilus TaxID=361280 RepID=A0ABU5CCB2_9BACI|nr:non-canonical purine NTP pyrophosphatase [Virgibacillus halophilus]
MRNVPQSSFVYLLSVYRANPQPFFTGYCKGKIAAKQSGKNGFGYDPVFIPEGYIKTMAELDPSEKNRISHRSNAFARLQEWIKLNLERDHDV